MNNKIKDGIVIGSSVCLSDGKDDKIPFYIYILKLLAVWAGVYSVIFTFTGCVQIPFSKVQINTVIFLAGIAFYALSLWKKYDLIKVLVFLTLLTAIVFRYHKQLINGFFIVENCVVRQLNSYLGIRFSEFVADYTFETEDTTLLIAIITVLITIVFSLAVVRNTKKGICYLVTMLPIIVSFLVGVTPSGYCLILYLAVMIFISVSGATKHQIYARNQKVLLNRINGGAAVLLISICLVLFFIFRLTISPTRYKEIAPMKEVKSNIQNFLFNVSLDEITDRFHVKKVSNPIKSEERGGLAGGKLINLAQVNYSGSEQLIVTLPVQSITGGIYLKGYVGTEYTGKSWEGLSKDSKDKYNKLLESIPEKDFPFVNQSNLFLKKILEANKHTVEQVTSTNFIIPEKSEYQIVNGKMKVEYHNANRNYIYAPYFTDFNQLDNIEYQQDLFAVPQKTKRNYEFDYYQGVDLNKSENLFQSDSIEGYQEYEKLYREYVHDVYTKMPEKGLEKLKEDFSQAGQELSSAEKIRYVKEYLGNMRYTLKPGELPKDKDYIEYFLYENKKGYCSHFASAGTMMLRAMGVPARYVEGYAIDLSAIYSRNYGGYQKITLFTDSKTYEGEVQERTISVKDNSAHAWVEVYIDGCGWFPVEFTPGASVNDQNSVVENMLNNQDKKEKKDKPSLTPTAKPTKAADKNDNKDQDNVIKKSNADKKQKENGQKLWKNKELVVWILVTLPILIPLLLIMIREFIKYLKRRKYSSENFNKKALILYKKVEKLLLICKVLPKEDNPLVDITDYLKEQHTFISSEEFSDFLSIALKARFSKHLILASEVTYMEKFHKELLAKVNKEVSIGKKLHIFFGAV